jgi:hypothetical protein
VASSGRLVRHGAAAGARHWDAACSGFFLALPPRAASPADDQATINNGSPAMRRCPRPFPLAACIVLLACGPATPPANGTRVVQVAPPTGARSADSTALSAALDAAKPGDTVRFAAGTYVIGNVEVGTDELTLRGDSAGTVLRGCAPEEQKRLGEEGFFAQCDGLALTGARQRVHALTFEHFDIALAIGGSTDSTGPVLNRSGGHRIEGNIFRDNVTLEVFADADSAIVIAGNTFRNTYHALAVIGRNVHVLDNDISAPEPDRVPFGWPSLAIGLRPMGAVSCAGTRIERNRISGHTDAVVLAVLPPDGPGASCPDVTIRENVIRMLPVLHSADAGPLAGTPAIGVPIRLLNMQAGMAAGAVTFPMPAPPGGWPATFADATVRDIVVEGNDIEGAIGVAIELVFAASSRVRGNRIGAITPMSDAEHARLTSARTFGVGPGLWVSDRDWRTINGTAVWVSPGGRDNDVADNNIATARPAAALPPSAR